MEDLVHYASIYPGYMYMCCDLSGSVGSRQHWLWDIASKRNEFLLFSIVLKTLQLLIALEPLDQLKWRFLAKCTSPSENFNQIENWECHMCEFRLIPHHILIISTCIYLLFSLHSHSSSSLFLVLFLPISSPPLPYFPLIYAQHNLNLSSL